MTTFLLDTNVLIAMGWPNHKHYQLARGWLDSLTSDNWATCPITECGFVRISSNARALPKATTTTGAMALLEQLTQKRGHIFWEDSIPLGKIQLNNIAIRGHQQVTDAYLLALCIERGGRLATFDRGILSLTSTDKARSHIHILQE